MKLIFTGEHNPIKKNLSRADWFTKFSTSLNNKLKRMSSLITVACKVLRNPEELVVSESHCLFQLFFLLEIHKPTFSLINDIYFKNVDIILQCISILSYYLNTINSLLHLNIEMHNNFDIDLYFPLIFST